MNTDEHKFSVLRGIYAYFRKTRGNFRNFEQK